MKNTQSGVRTKPLPARGDLTGMRVIYRGGTDVPPVVWTINSRHPEKGHWWVHRRDELGQWVTNFARYTQLEQVIS